MSHMEEVERRSAALYKAPRVSLDDIKAAIACRYDLTAAEGLKQLTEENQQLKQLIQSGQVAKTESETKRNLATAAKTMKDIGITEAQIPKLHAETIKTLEESNNIATRGKI